MTQTIAASALSPRRLAGVVDLLRRAGVDWDAGVEFTVVLEDDGGRAIATGSRRDNVLQCIAVDPGAQGEGLAATVVTELVKNAVLNGHSHLFIFTAPKSARIFTQLGFFPVAETAEAALLENRRDGAAKFVAGLENPRCDGGKPVSAIVANCNPFTRGHRYLVEVAAAASGLVHLFILSADKSRFSAADRMAMVAAGVADLPNVVVHPTSDYLVSSATFPSYFIKDKVRAEGVNCALDLTIFARCFAKPLGIVRRYAGTEPTDAVTRAYNRQMRDILPRFGIEVVETPRLEEEAVAVSAGRVRALLDEGRLEEAEKLVPPATRAFLRMMAPI